MRGKSFFPPALVYGSLINHTINANEQCIEEHILKQAHTHSYAGRVGFWMKY